MENTDPGLSEGIFGAGAYEAQLPQKRDFLPWHKPRKQFVRDMQWCEQIKKLLEECQIEGNTLKYLGLPGIDLLDLRYIHNTICADKGLNLRFLGFNDGANPKNAGQTELNVSLDEVKRLPFVDKGSLVIPDNFCGLANDTSFAFSHAQAHSPYHVVNLDFCDGFCAHPPDVLDETYYNALNRLLALQSRSKEPWILLLTTRAGETSINPDVLAKLVNRYNENLANEAFLDASTELLKIGNEESLQKAVATPEGKLPIFLVGLCKWLAGLAANQSPPTSVELKSIMGYRVGVKAQLVDLLSLALRFTPRNSPGLDPAGLARSDSTPVNEGELAAKALRKVVLKQVDADVVLREKPELYEQMVNDTASLLELARYDTQAWREWELDNFKAESEMPYAQTLAARTTSA